MDVAKLLKEAGIESTPETLAKATTSINAAEAATVLTETTGLKSKNEELKAEKVAAKEAEKVAKQEKDDALEAKLKADGKTEELKKFYDDKKDEALVESTRLNKELKDANSARDLATTRAKFGGKFLHQSDASLYLDKMVTVGEDGKSTFTDLDGKTVVAANPEEFDKWLDTNKSMAHVLKAVDSSGGGGGGGGDDNGGGDGTESLESVISNAGK